MFHEEIIRGIAIVAERLRLVADRLDLVSKEQRITMLEAEVSVPDLWKNREEAERLNKELGMLRSEVEEVHSLMHEVQDLEALGDLIHNDEALAHEVEEKLSDLTLRVAHVEQQTLLTGTYDHAPAILSIYSGAGGNDAQDWVAMLKDMYLRYSARNKWHTHVVDETLGEYGGKTGRHTIKNVTIEIRGTNVYGYLKGEAGVHRLVRISPFSAKQLRHTSFALVEVLPELSEMDESALVIRPEDLSIELSRASGPGGQNVNKRETAVRIVHIPTGIAASSQAERSQPQNKERAMKILKAKLYQRMMQARVEELGALHSHAKPEWGSQIRSYVLHPYQLVKDHRTNVESSRVDEVLAGNLDLFIEAEMNLESRK
ncbi:MAG: peptide chain release factor 2 [Patescibacteria group bacterium]|nr:peptide chain release factor 2 [Patescibacteria group bacterium]MDE2437983.1 peptide chain release factor 2 [Patescibacteria group bacterium]